VANNVGAVIALAGAALAVTGFRRRRPAGGAEAEAEAVLPAEPALD
jgi:hypothetical protein